MNPDVLSALEAHQQWLAGTGGMRFRMPGTDFTGTDFTGYSLQRSDIRHSILTDCIMPADCTFATMTTCTGTNVDFSKSTIDQAAFETTDISGFNLVGATWGGTVLKANPIQWISDNYWVMQTDVLARINCKEYTIAQWNAFTSYDRHAFDVGLNQDSDTWWANNKNTINTNATIYAAS